jgi:GalNAc-alpha-(1->4)-GalNAc-alpha-(1->3)-diNAcBac-PP-undecaprenol alpha-1,4-N-acetyl-D-galactosaminyltransferase
MTVSHRRNETTDDDREKLLLVVSSLAHPGGAERQMVAMANHWAQEGRRVAMLTFDSQRVTPFFKLDPSVQLIPLELMRDSRSLAESLSANASRVWRIRAVIRRESPHVVVSFGTSTNVLLLLAIAGTGVPLVVSERTMPSRARLGRAWRLLRRVLYPFADAVVVQSRSAAACFPWLSSKVRVVPNRVESPTRVREKTSVPSKTIVAAGRFTAEKGFATLIDAFSACKAREAGWSLVIYGDGPLRGSLEERISSYGLEHQIALPGAIADLPNELVKADLFVLSSLYEGFPNVLCEAMAAGVPVIATRCPGGVVDIVGPEAADSLVPPSDFATLADAIDRLAFSPVERQRIAEKGFEVTERFSLSRVSAEWESLFDRLRAQ